MLIIGHTWPEPTTTGAGVRMIQLIELFQQLEFSITFACTAGRTPYSASLEDYGVGEVAIELNSESFDHFVAELDPNVVMFDRFMTEEQFGWRVAQQCPAALRILDTEDLHFLRKARQRALAQDSEALASYLYSDVAKRELASILRCDLSLIISQAEYTLLTHRFSIPEGQLFYLPFLWKNSTTDRADTLPRFEQRSGFITVGNGMHPPNEDALLYLSQEIWPLIRKELPEAELRNYGAYASSKLQALHQPEQGFHMMGWVKDLDAAMQVARVCLAPLRFGAGLKGKIMKAMECGTPFVTTGVGREGYTELLPLGPQPSDPISFAHEAIQCYQKEDVWRVNSEQGFKILAENFQWTDYQNLLAHRLEDITNELTKHRQHHFLGQILHHQSLQSTKYMSKWIEAKNKLKS